MYFNSSFRFRTKKVVGSPSAEGNGQHTIASHIGDADPHPNYLLKGEESRPFDISEHLAAVLDHAVGYIRRGEVAEGKRDYLQNRFLSLINDPNNYGALLQAKRHVITAYVLNQVLEDFGLVDDVKLENYVLRDHIVTSESGAPETDQEEYVVGWVLYKNLLTKYANLNTAAQTWVTKTEANNFSRITHTHRWADIENITGSTFATKTEVDDMFADFLSRLSSTVTTELDAFAVKLGYVLTGDTVYKPETKYYSFDDVNNEFVLMVTGTNYTVGSSITGEVWTKPETVGVPVLSVNGLVQRSTTSKVTTGSNPFSWENLDFAEADIEDRIAAYISGFNANNQYMKAVRHDFIVDGATVKGIDYIFCAGKRQNTARTAWEDDPGWPAGKLYALVSLDIGMRRTDRIYDFAVHFHTPDCAYPYTEGSDTKVPSGANIALGGVGPDLFLCHPDYTGADAAHLETKTSHRGGFSGTIPMMKGTFITIRYAISPCHARIAYAPYVDSNTLL